jgi:hypothetical protein
MEQERRIVTRDWDRYDTRHVVYRPARLNPAALKDGYDWAYREFYRWSSIRRASLSHGSLKHQAKHFFYATGWKKFEPLWDMVIRARQLRHMTPILEAVLSRITRREMASGAGTGRARETPSTADPILPLPFRRSAAAWLSPDQP